MRKIKAFLYRLFFGKPRPTRVFGFGGGGYTGAVQTPAKADTLLDAFVPGGSSAKPTPKPVVPRANYPEPPKRVLTVGDNSDNKSMIFCEDSNNGQKRTV
jgi:hypothetical protein